MRQDFRDRAGPGDVVVVYRRREWGAGGIAALGAAAVVIAFIGTGTVKEPAPSVTATVRVNTPVALQQSATSATPVLMSLPDGSTVTVTCTVDGSDVQGWNGPSSTWDRVRIDGVTGFLPDADLVTSRAVADVVPPC